MASGTNLDDIVEPGFYPGFAADTINKPGGAGSGFLTVAELSTGVGDVRSAGVAGLRDVRHLASQPRHGRMGTVAAH